ncbi:two-component system sensor histidine kinase AtoS [Siculibacillus lacustris]|uniref:histidine kinase n=1 Tax=Siculibacillus lacustris TaxID=1549641 RepID=A0A4Q9VYF4_9HYPH|nr:two-component system sensor histidine kinase AtoS [Siculibacillus lacustris]
MRLTGFARFLPTRSLRNRLMLTSLVVVALPIAIVGVVLEREGRQALVTEKQDKLFALTRILDADLGPGFDALLADLPSGWSDHDAAVRHLNARLAVLTDRLAAADPGVGVGYYSRRLDAIVTYGPSRDYGATVGQPIKSDHPGRRVMETGQPRVEVGALVRGPIMNAMLPIVRGGETIGYIWANEFSDAIERQQRRIDEAVILSSIGGLVLAFLIIWIMSRRLSRDVEVIVEGLEVMKTDLHRPIPHLRDELGGVVVAINAMAKALLDARSLTENILTSIADGVVAVDREGRVTAINPAAEMLYEIRAGDALGRLYCEVFAGCPTESLLLGTLDNGRPRVSVTIDYLRGDEVLKVDASSSVLRDGDGNQIGAVVVLKDVTERHRLMGQVMRADRLAALGELTAGIAHEIRNPLTSIRGFVQYLDDCETIEEWRQYGPLIIRQVDSLNRIIGELLAFGRPRPPQIGKVKLDVIVEETTFLTRGKSGARIELDLDRSVPEIEADGEALKQALLNLVINAIQAIPETGTVVVSTRSDGEGNAVIRVIDDGVGVDPENLDKVFDPFFSTKPTGTGLGLAMVHRIVDAHHGVITIESRPGAGTTVTVRLPFAQPEPEALP